MPRTKVVLYLEDDGTTPVLDALQSLLAGGQRKVVARCWVRIERLAEVGHVIKKTKRVPDTEIARALAHKKRLEDDPEKHTLRR